MELKEGVPVWAKINIERTLTKGQKYFILNHDTENFEVHIIDDHQEIFTIAAGDFNHSFSLVHPELDKIIPDEVIEEVFMHTNFGPTKPRDVLKSALLKHACGYANGKTSHAILKELFLVDNNQNLTEKGKKYLYESFKE